MNLTPREKYDDVDDATLALLAKTVRGTSVLGMVHDAAELGDIRALTALHAAGRFRIANEDIDATVEAGENSRSVLSETAVPLIDSLGNLIRRREMCSEDVGTEFVSATMQIPHTVLTMRTSVTAAEKTVMHQVFSDILDDLDGIEFDVEDPDDNRKDVVRATRGVVAAIAATLNDHEILLRCATVDNGMALQEHQKHTGLLVNVGNAAVTRLHPSAFALIFGSKECLSVFADHDPGRLQGMGISPTRGLDLSGWRWTPFDLLENLDGIKSLKPDVLNELLIGLSGHSWDYPQAVREWLPKQATELAAKNPYLAQTLIDQHVMEADPRVASEIVFKNAIPRLAAHLLSNDLVDFPRLQKMGPSPDTEASFPKGHPARELTTFNSSNIVRLEDRDETLALVIHAMARAGHAAELHQARDGRLYTLTEQLVQNGMKKSLGAQIANGADVSVTNEAGDSLLRIAQLLHPDDKDMHDLLRAAQARQAATAALSDLGLEAPVGHDLAREVQSRTPKNFDAWMASSSETKAQGTPLVLWRAGADADPGEGPVWLTFSRAVAANLGNVDEDSSNSLHGYHVAMQKPAFDADVASAASDLDIEFDPDSPLKALDFGNGADAVALLRRLKNNGHDGVIGIETSSDATDKWSTYIAFSPQQVKHLQGEELARAVKDHAQAMESVAETSFKSRRFARGVRW